MAKAKSSKSSKSKEQHLKIALTNKNYSIIGLGILVIIIGYVLMSANSVDGFLPTVIAPILLVAGYCVIIPFGILYKDKSNADEDISSIDTKNTVKVSTSNIKTN